MLPWLAVLGVQTWAIASGRAHSPASTTGHPGYWIVNAVTLALAVGVARQLAKRRRRSPVRNDQPAGHSLPVGLGVLATTVISAGLSAVYGLATRPAHPGHGSTPPVMLAGLLALVATLAALAVAGRRRRPDIPPSGAAMAVERS